MRTVWAEVMKQRLRAAAADPPTAELIRPQVQTMARAAVQATASARSAPQVQVRVTRGRIVVVSSGPGSDRVARRLRADLTRNRRLLTDTLRADALTKIKGSR